jgi:hypothetical protein
MAAKPLLASPGNSYGCGDSFSAGFTLALACGASVEEAADLGARLGALGPDPDRGYIAGTHRADARRLEQPPEQAIAWLLEPRLSALAKGRHDVLCLVDGDGARVARHLVAAVPEVKAASVGHRGQRDRGSGGETRAALLAHGTVDAGGIAGHAPVCCGVLVCTVTLSGYDRERSWP